MVDDEGGYHSLIATALLLGSEDVRHFPEADPGQNRSAFTRASDALVTL
jgi:hypothetical protein